jgi:hypothetical protein
VTVYGRSLAFAFATTWRAILATSSEDCVETSSSRGSARWMALTCQDANTT